MSRIRTEGGLIGSYNNPSIAGASGMWTMRDIDHATRTGSWPINSPIQDPYYYLNTMHIHADNVNNANNTVFNDYSAAYTPFNGTYSNLFTAASSQYLSIPNFSPFLATTTTPFTIEGWVYYITYPAATGGLIFTSVFGGGGANIPFLLGISNGNVASPGAPSAGAAYAWFAAYTGSTWTGLVSTSSVINLNTWYHIAVSYDGTTTRLFVNGNIVGSATSGISYQTSAGATGSKIGVDYGAGGLYLNGYVSNVRFVMGTALYTAAFTPSTTPLTAVTNTKLLTCQSSTFVDNSPNAYTITNVNGVTTTSGNINNITTNGKPVQGTFSPFSQTGWSNYFNGSTDYITHPGTQNNFGTGDLTIECWVYPTGTAPTGVSTDSNRWIYGSRSGTTASPYISWGSGSTGLYVGTDPSNVIVSAVQLTLFAWQHIAWTRTSGTSRLFINGVLVGSASDTNNYTDISTKPIGASISGASYNFNGYISNFRIIRGTSLYSAAFTPPTTTLTAITNTILLTTQSNRFIDNSTNAFTITPSGTPSIQPLSPFAATQAYSNNVIGGSSYFNGSTDYLSYPSAFLQGATSGSPYTVEAWVYPLSTSGIAIMSSVYNGSANIPFVLGLSNGSFPNATGLYPAFGTYNGSSWSAINSASTIPLNAWSHIAASSNGTTTQLYVNGAQVASGTLPFNAASASNPGYYIGRRWDTSSVVYYNGYIADARISASQIYASAFTPPTAPLSANSTTILLHKGINAGIFDQTAKSAITTYGSAAISTSQSKFGGSSMSLPGSGSYVVMPYNSVPSILSGDFTIEAFLFFNSISGSNIAVINQWQQTAGLGGFCVYFNNGVFGFSFGAISEAGGVMAGGTVTTGQWYHTAVVRSGSTFTLYLNGSNSNTITSTATRSPISVNYSLGNYYTSAGALGATGATDFNGFIDELRITKYARYTSNFTPPAQSFLNQ